MHKASYVMYSIANFFTWIVVLLSIAIIVLSILGGANVVPALREAGFNWGYMVYGIVLLIVSLITIAMVRRAKAKGSSKAWDVLFIILGVLGANIFYVLGGIFGLFARKQLIYEETINSIITSGFKRIYFRLL